jgi:chromosome segregation ATPase
VAVEGTPVAGPACRFDLALASWDAADTMKTLLQNLLLVFALGLCALVFWQWQRELRLRAELRVTASQVRALHADLRLAESEIERLEGIKRRYEDTTATNALTAREWEARAREAAEEIERLAQQMAELQAALDRANTNLLQANAELRELAEERNDVVAQFNELATSYNELAARWNELQGRLATNAALPGVTP